MVRGEGGRRGRMEHAPSFGSCKKNEGGPCDFATLELRGVGRAGRGGGGGWWSEGSAKHGKREASNGDRASLLQVPERCRQCASQRRRQRRQRQQRINAMQQSRPSKRRVAAAPPPPLPPTAMVPCQQLAAAPPLPPSARAAVMWRRGSPTRPAPARSRAAETHPVAAALLHGTSCVAMAAAAHRSRPALHVDQG